MARRRKSSNDPLAFLITAFLMIPFALAAIFKLLFKGISCLASFIGKCIEKRRLKQQTYTYNTRSSYQSSTIPSATALLQAIHRIQPIKHVTILLIRPANDLKPRADRLDGGKYHKNI